MTIVIAAVVATFALIHYAFKLPQISTGKNTKVFVYDDESTIDNNYLGNEDERIKRTKKLNKIVDELDSLITDNFYLRRAQEFHYGHYEYH